MKVSKFGGTSLANAGQIRKVLSIIRSDPERQYVVVSAPGKRWKDDQKVTDLLHEWHRHQELGISYVAICKIVKSRYEGIARELGINFDVEKEIAEIRKNIDSGASLDYVLSRGEYLSGKIIAAALGYHFVDPATCIHFDENGCYQENDARIVELLEEKRVVVPGFYGSTLDGHIKTFPRGGSDITGAIVAKAVRADIYENWTDVPGLLMADPGIVHNPKKMEVVTYDELRELSYMGANVFHEEAMFPVRAAEIPTNIRNTNDLTDPGTLIVAGNVEHGNPGSIVGIAGRKGFAVITIRKAMMNQQKGFALRVLTVLRENDISFEHLPGSVDTLSVIIDDKQLDGKFEKVLRGINELCSPDSLEADSDMAMIAVVGKRMAHTPGVAAKLLTAIANEGINVRMINQGSSEISIIVGVANEDYEAAVRAIYSAFVNT